MSDDDVGVDVEGLSMGDLQSIQFGLEDAIEHVDTASKRLGIDRRTSMPDTTLSTEYKLRRARQLLASVHATIELARREL